MKIKVNKIFLSVVLSSGEIFVYYWFFNGIDWKVMIIIKVIDEYMDKLLIINGEKIFFVRLIIYGEI